MVPVPVPRLIAVTRPGIASNRDNAATCGAAKSHTWMHEFHLLPRPLQITTAKLGENWIVFPLLMGGLVLAVWHATGHSLLWRAGLSLPGQPSAFQEPELGDNPKNRIDVGNISDPGAVDGDHQPGYSSDDAEEDKGVHATRE